MGNDIQVIRVILNQPRDGVSRKAVHCLTCASFISGTKKYEDVWLSTAHDPYSVGLDSVDSDSLTDRLSRELYTLYELGDSGVVQSDGWRALSTKLTTPEALIAVPPNATVVSHDTPTIGSDSFRYLHRRFLRDTGLYWQHRLVRFDVTESGAFDRVLFHTMYREVMTTVIGCSDGTVTHEDSHLRKVVSQIVHGTDGSVSSVGMPTFSLDFRWWTTRPSVANRYGGPLLGYGTLTQAKRRGLSDKTQHDLEERLRNEAEAREESTDGREVTRGLAKPADTEFALEKSAESEASTEPRTALENEHALNSGVRPSAKPLSNHASWSLVVAVVAAFMTATSGVETGMIKLSRGRTKRNSVRAAYRDNDLWKLW